MEDSDTLAWHRAAQQSFAGVLAGVSAAQLDDPTPCAEWTVGQLVDHVIAGNLRVAGQPSPGPLDPATMLEVARDSAAAAEATFEAPDGISRTYDLGIGTVPGAMFLALRTGDVFTHAWDLARATGQPSDLDPELAERILEMITPILRPELRGEGRPFGAEQPCDSTAAAADRLAAFTGRTVS
jgi:uncharacterized protein (TIGR03086 family)